MKIFKPYILSVLLALTVCQFAFADPAVISNQAWGFEITPAANWYQAKIPTGYSESKVILAAKGFETKPPVLFVNVIPTEGRSLQTLVSMSKSYILTSMGGRILEEAPVTIGGLKGYRLQYQGQSTGYSENWRRYVRIFLQDGSKFYVLHGVAQPKHFQNYREDFNAMMSSFRLAGR